MIEQHTRYFPIVRPNSSSHSAAGGALLSDRRDEDGVRLAQIFDLFGEDRPLNAYAGELEVRPPRAPTTALDIGEPVSS